MHSSMPLGFVHFICNSLCYFSYILTAFDKNRDGKLGFSEFILAAAAMDKKDLTSRSNLPSICNIAFKYINVSEEIGENVLAQVFFFIFRIDTSGDQLTSYDEMVKFVSIEVKFSIYISHNWIKYFFF